jgi:RNA polymerase sigma-70 factor (ECF subfamily)
MRRTDEQLMLKYRNGNKDSFEILYRRYEKPVFDLIYRMVMNSSEAESLCQETFYRVIRARKKYVPVARFKTWLFQIAINLCRDSLRRMKHRSHVSLSSPLTSNNPGSSELQEVISDPAPDIADQVESEELESIIKAAIATLPEDEHLVLSLKEYQGMTFAEIAEILDCPVGTLKSLHHRAREKLKKILAKYIGD